MTAKQFLKKFNNLDGKKKVPRAKLSAMVFEAKKFEKSQHADIIGEIQQKIANLIITDGADYFEITLEKKYELPKIEKSVPQGLNGIGYRVVPNRPVRISYRVVTAEPEVKEIAPVQQPQQEETTVATPPKRVIETPKQSVKAVVAKPTVKKTNKRRKSLAEEMAERSNVQREYYNILPEYKQVSDFLGPIEKKTKGSVVVTLAAPQGAGKTRYLFQLMNAFAGSGYACGHASLEEEVDSALYDQKVLEYLNYDAQQNIEAPHIDQSNKQRFWELVENNEIIFIDSMKKLWQFFPKIDMDNDLRKKYHGKIFVIIFQLTANGKMRGGSDAQFDGDIISFIEKEPDYRDSYVWFDKNRYHTTPLNELKYSIYHKKLIGTETTNEAPNDIKDIGYSVVN